MRKIKTLMCGKLRHRKLSHQKRRRNGEGLREALEIQIRTQLGLVLELKHIMGEIIWVAVSLKNGAVAEEPRLEEVHNQPLAEKRIKERMISHGLLRRKRKKKLRLTQNSSTPTGSDLTQT
tara:strand:- start:371 stop:733 length:363 start_codon:yes stop_codon:yes gene_type:complete